jgi:hypothetical protein
MSAEAAGAQPASALVNSRTTGDITTTGQALADVTGLSFPVGANEVWQFEVYARVGSSSAAGCSYGFTFPVGATLEAITLGSLASANAMLTDRITATNTAGAVYNTGAVTTAANCAILQARGVVVNGATAGTVQFKHLKVTSGTSTVYANSCVVARRIG